MGTQFARHGIDLPSRSEAEDVQFRLGHAGSLFRDVENYGAAAAGAQGTRTVLLPPP